MMKPSHALKAGIIVSIAVVILFVFSAAAPAMSSSQQANAFTSQTNLLPNPVLNSNVTWSTYYHGWNPLEYSNGSANLTLQASLNSEYQNPITVNPSGIQSSAFKETLGTSGIYWNKTYYIYGGNNAGITAGTGKLTMETSSSDTSTNTGKIYWNISTAYIPSLNPQYDYATILYTSTQTGTGNAYIEVGIGNGSTIAGVNGKMGVIQNEATITSESLNNPTTGTVFESMQASSFVKNFRSGYMQIGISQNLPQTTTGSLTVTTTILGLMLSSNPISLGTYSNKTGEHPITGMETATSQNLASTLNPDFSWTSINNNSYTVAVSQPLQNLTTQQNAISSGNYIEQVEYQGSFGLPAAPDLSYSASSISEKFNVSSSQTQVLDINGLSYLSAISGKNGTVTLLSGVNPNSQTQFLQIVDYTSSQWESVSGPPGFFSVNGILYYFDEIVLGIIAVVGLAGGAAVARTRSLRRVK